MRFLLLEEEKRSCSIGNDACNGSVGATDTERDDFRLLAVFFHDQNTAERCGSRVVRHSMAASEIWQALYRQ
ncbi:hypothetical protein BKE38_01775 [Pseudoroseomonas deserti]|uniref:Uncharacterized protein n=1 Tax=Teichococcus deserti TaxID=1817963 RepID=A0A1V2H7H1_9PROT|nr:hypothetical protein BKE38_01775 [Pseudoroseomonas deserti]